MPVDAKVAAILRPTWPDLPMPVTISRPLDCAISSTAATSGAPSPSRIAATSAAMPPASASSVRSAELDQRARVRLGFGFAFGIR